MLTVTVTLNFDLKITRDHLHSEMQISARFDKPRSILCLVIIQTRFGLPTDGATWAKQYTPTSMKGGIKMVLTLSQTSPGFHMSAVYVFWKHCGKRRNCSWRAISLFPSVFSSHLDNLFVIFIKLTINHSIFPTTQLMTTTWTLVKMSSLMRQKMLDWLIDWMVFYAAFISPQQLTLLTLSQMTNFRLSQTEWVCRRQFWSYIAHLSAKQ